MHRVRANIVGASHLEIMSPKYSILSACHTQTADIKLQKSEETENETLQTWSTRHVLLTTYFANVLSYDLQLNANKQIEELERELWKLEAMIHSPTSVAADGKLSYNDIEFFPRMRGLTIVQGLGIPPKLRAYLDAVSEKVDIPL